MENKTKIIVVDDHSFFRKGVILAVNRMPDIEVVAEAASGVELLEILKTTKTDIVLVDIKMPDMDGIEATTQVLNKYPHIKVLALTMHGDEAYIESMLNAGAMGYMLKSSESEDLEQALKSLLNNQQYYSSELLPQLTNRFLKKPDEKSKVKLTGRELEVLDLVFKGYTNQEIANQLCLSLRTITTHRTNLNLKTGAKNTAGLIGFAIKNKLVNIDEII